MVQSLAKSNNESISSRWEPLLNNLGHCCRKNRKYEEALHFHQRALTLKPQSASTYAAIGFVQSLMGKLEESVDTLHKCLSIRRDDVFAANLLKYVIEDLLEEDSLFAEDVCDTTSDGEKGETSESDKPKLNCMKLKFDDYDSTTSQQSEMAESNYDISMDM